MYNLIFNISIINHLSLMKTTGVDFQGGGERLTIAISLRGDIFVADPMPFSMNSTFYPPRPVVGSVKPISHYYYGCQTARCSKISTRILVSGGRKVATRPTHDDRMKSPVDTLGGPGWTCPPSVNSAMQRSYRNVRSSQNSIMIFIFFDKHPFFYKNKRSCGRVARR